MKSSARGEPLRVGFFLNAENARLQENVSARLPECGLNDSIGGRKIARKIEDEQRRYRDVYHGV